LQLALPGSEEAAVASLESLHHQMGAVTVPGEVADLQTAALLATGKKLDLALAAVLIVAEASDGASLEETELEAAAKACGRAATAVLSP
jgi:hypothetical protein